jgi:hypothetical protein
VTILSESLYGVLQRFQKKVRIFLEIRTESLRHNLDLYILETISRLTKNLEFINMLLSNLRFIVMFIIVTNSNCTFLS